MIYSKPSYYDSFRCIAGACPDSCCKEWSVQVDDFSAEYYRSLPGDLGDTLRRVLVEEDGDTVMAIRDGRCPMWRQDGLCRIQAELGEEALCDVCRDFPRISHDFGDFAELQLELSCPEAARLILTAPPAPPITWEEEDGEEPEYDPEEMARLKAIRAQLLEILADDRLTPGEALLRVYREGTSDRAQGGTPAMEGITDFFLGLEILTDQWPRKLAAARPRPLVAQARNLARYLLERYWLQDMGDVRDRVAFAVICCLVVNALEGDFTENAQLFSKEIENSDCNPRALILAARKEAAFSPANIAALLNS